MDYKMPFNQYKLLQKMSKNELSRWINTFAQEMWKQGFEDGRKGIKEIPDTSIIIDTEEAVVIDMEYDKLYEEILSVKGVGPALCKKIMDKLYEDYDNRIKDMS